ncbi:MAG: SEC-C domain-containing protein [Myxococcaceae bacterium]|nr:SEC-C domain-containing protein [Myxococcaceae bacterium]
MRFIFRLGPIELETEPPKNVYVSCAPSGVDLEWGGDDAQAVALLASRGGRGPVTCEPALEQAARAAGLKCGQLPDEALAVKAAMAVQLDLGEALAAGDDPAIILELIDALADFEAAGAWESFEPDEVVAIELKKPRRSLDACVMGQNDEVYGLVLYDLPGAASRSRSDEELRAEPCTSIWLEHGPSFAVDAVKALTGVAFSPGGVRMKHGEPQPLTAADIALLIAGLRAITELANSGRDEATGRAEGRPRVELRATREPMPEVPELERATDFTGVGRNEPCPCGSGRKYKQCHLGTDAAPKANRTGPHQPLHDRDSELVTEVLRSLPRRDLGRELFGGRAISEQIVGPLLAWEWPESGADRTFERQGSRLSESDRAWISAQRAARTRVHEVLRVERSTGVEVLDLLSGERVFVHERSGSESLVERDVILARVVRSPSAVLFGGMHESSLGPREARLLVDRARAEGLGDGTWKSTLRLIALWDEAVGDRALKLASPRQVRNADGHQAVMVDDHYTIEKGAYASVLSKLAHLEGASVSERGKKVEVTLATKTSVVATLELTERKLVAHTNSVERADDVRARLESAAAAAVRFRDRKKTELPKMRGGDDLIIDVQPMNPAAALDVQRSWLDVSIPALGDRTPREAVKDEAGREAVHWLLKEHEHQDARSPREDVVSTGKQLRRELGLDELGGFSPLRELDRSVGAGRKLSATLLDYAQHVLDENPKQLDGALRFAMAVWNLAALEEQGADAGRLADARAELEPGRHPVALMKHFDALMKRKRERFAGDLRLAADLRIEHSKAGVGVFVATMLTPDLAEKVKAAGLKPPG